MTWRHDQLAEDLAAHLWAGGQHLTWLDFAPKGWSDPARPDVYAIKRGSFTAPSVVSYEVKVSTSDLRSDLTSAKWQKYLAFSNGVTFAVPQGLCAKKDIPDGCGLIVRSERGWRHARKPSLGRLELDTDTMLRLIQSPPMRSKLSAHAVGDDWERRYLVKCYTDGAVARGVHAVGKRLGKQVADVVAARMRGEDLGKLKVSKAREEAKQVVADAQAQSKRCWEDLAEALGLPPETSRWDIQTAARRLRGRLNKDAEVSALRKQLHDAMRALQHIDLPIDDSEAA